MRDSIARFFGAQMAPGTADKSADQTQRLQVATCALLLEAAHADQEFSPQEQQTIITLVREQFGLDKTSADRLIALAEEERQQSPDLFQFTRLISDQFDRNEKLAILQSLWKVVYSDGRLEAHEDALLHKLSTLLGIKHRDMIAVKLHVKNQDSS